MKVSEIHDDREFYEAVHEYASKVWDWRAHVVDKYLRKRNGPTWVRVIDGSRADPAV